ncbi:MAG TPA: NAD(P)H-dependent glycerol-3-phosphate dehydrogenase [Acidimicrobiales bacterium]|nr:NAD(P)H-dependent glycerol-3-phosphate dehydrogenase [Acidimicrobiales bacterium]
MVAVLGAGMWGTTMARLLAARAPTVLWARRAGLADHLNRRHRNRDYLPTIALPESLQATASLAEALGGADVIVMALPSHGFREILQSAEPHLTPSAPIVTLTKGVEQGSLMRMTEIVAEVAPNRPYGVLTGPNLAQEVAAGHPTASVISIVDAAGFDQTTTRELQELFSTETFRVYTNDDLVGCELGGALKNVIAIASGIADGMGFGDNTRAALITRGLAELTRLGVALGGQPLTFSGLAGLGDLVATCMSRQSRNRWVGEQLGNGRAVDEITAETRMVAEGIKTSKAALELGRRAGVETPIVEQVVAVLYDGKRATDALAALMHRETRPELHGFSPLAPARAAESGMPAADAGTPAG